MYQISGTSSLVIGQSTYEHLSSESSTTNGVGSAYGDDSYINMTPYQSPVNDPNMSKEQQISLPSQRHKEKTSSPPHGCLCHWPWYPCHYF